jgi:triosephosphate isomerase
MANGRKYLIAGNWKMNVPSSDAKGLAAEIVDKTQLLSKADVLVCPPFTSIQAVKDIIGAPGGIFLGAQNFYPEKSGAYTGEISPAMLRELGVSHVIVGHSERRSLFGESDALINRKVESALSNSLIPILCIGETIEQRRKGRAFEVVQNQIKIGLANVSLSESKKLVIAYEPVWAIGTGETATPQIAQEMHAFIRAQLKDLFDANAANSIKILYGGSMKAENAAELLRENDIDGGLIGGASLSAKSFVEIIKAANELSN